MLGKALSGVTAYGLFAVISLANLFVGFGYFFFGEHSIATWHLVLAFMCRFEMWLEGKK